MVPAWWFTVINLYHSLLCLCSTLFPKPQPSSRPCLSQTVWWPSRTTWRPCSILCHLAAQVAMVKLVWGSSCLACLRTSVYGDTDLSRWACWTANSGDKSSCVLFPETWTSVFVHDNFTTSTAVSDNLSRGKIQSCCRRKVSLLSLMWLSDTTIPERSSLKSRKVVLSMGKKTIITNPIIEIIRILSIQSMKPT